MELPTSLKRIQGPTYTYDEMLNELKYGLGHKNRIAWEKQMQAKEKNKVYYDRTANPLELKVNDLVMKENKLKSHKYDNVWVGPYRVEKILSPVTVMIKRGKKSEKIHIDQLKLSVADHGAKTPPEIPQ